jgi:predicted ATPase/DNA-binding XRE family transcriptional regulator
LSCDSRKFMKHESVWLRGETRHNGCVRSTDSGGSFGAILRSYRRAAELTQEELAERAGISVRSISDLERGTSHRPRRDTVEMIVLALGLDDDERVALEAALDYRRGPRPASISDPSPSRPVQARHNLPRQLTSFVGREHELRELEAVLDETALLTLTGAGGVGKTRLAEELVHRRLDSYPDGVWLVELAAVDDPARVPGSVASALEVAIPPGRGITQCLVENLRQAHLLLVVDNCEHLVQACAELIAALLRDCPHLQVLATSREPLGIAGETTWQVHPLQLPERFGSAERIQTSAAGRLFLDRARAVQHTLMVTDDSAPAIARICLCVDGIPLALELAAARLSTLSVHELADRLEGDPHLLASRVRIGLAQHRTLHATIQWSFDLLDERERALFRHLAIFAGGWSLQLAESVCADVLIGASDVLELLGRLVEKSMVVMDTRGHSARFRLLEPIRQYALELLDNSGEAATYRARHAAALVELAATGEAQLGGTDEIDSLDRLELEHDNVRAALRWSIDHGDGASALKLATAMWRFWERRGYHQEARDWLEQALAKSDGAPSEVRGNALNALAMLHWSTGDAEVAEPLAGQALSVCQTAGDVRGMAWALLNLGMIAYYEADAEHAIARLERSATLARQAADVPLLSLAVSSVGRVTLWARGPHDVHAASCLQEGLALAQQAQSRHATSQALGGLAELAWRQGDLEKAIGLWQQALRLRRQLGDQRGIATCIERLAQLAAATGQTERAAWLWGAAEARRELIGLRLRHDEAADRARLMTVGARAISESDFTRAHLQGRDATIDAAVEFAFQHGDQLQAPKSSHRRG